MSAIEQLPIAVIGAGPIGLAAAAQLALRNLPYVVLEASDGVAASFRSTAHVRLFSPWKMNIDPAAALVLEQHAWHAPDPDVLPTASDMRSLYLEPLAQALAPNIRFDTRVERISRRGFDKVKSQGRQAAPFVLRIRTPGTPADLMARAVIDACGTWATPNWMGANGLPALGEQELSARIQYGMPDILGSERARYADKHVLVVGSGHSAAGSLIALSELARREPNMRIAWAIRSDNPERIFGGGSKDGLPERGNLGLTLRALIERGTLALFRAFQIEAVRQASTQLEVIGRNRDDQQQVIAGIDEIIVATGSRPELALASELRLRLDPWLESTEQLAPLIDPNLHSCGTVPPHGHRELTHPEPGYYAIGAKSYGRAPNFLLATGYEQARSVVAALAGDIAAADDVRLVLPETGICATEFDGQTTGACGAAPAPSAQPSAAGCCAPSTQPVVAGCCPAPAQTQAKAGCCG